MRLIHLFQIIWLLDKQANDMERIVCAHYHHLTLPASIQRLSAREHTLRNSAAGFSFSHSFACIAFTWSLRNERLWLFLIIVSNSIWLITFFRGLSLYNRLEQGSEHVRVIVFLAVNSCLHSSE